MQMPCKDYWLVEIRVGAYYTLEMSGNTGIFACEIDGAARAYREITLLLCTVNLQDGVVR